MTIGAQLSGKHRTATTTTNFPQNNTSHFRAIYDNDEYKQFSEKLQQRIRSYDKDIERLCNVYYQGFIESVRELLEVRSHAKKLNVSISLYEADF